MIIGGIQKNSFIDYPSKVSCVIFTAGCNFECPYCHNPGLVKPSSGIKTIDVQEVFAFLKKRRPLLDGVVITGGEPSLQKDLFDFCKQIKSLNFPVKLDTNGSRPGVLSKLINKKLVDYVAMDIKTIPDRYSPLFTKRPDIEKDIRLSIKIIKDSGIPHEFRTTCVKSIIDKNAIHTILQLVLGADLYVLQKANIKKQSILNPEYFNTLAWEFDSATIESFRELSSQYVKNTLVR